MGIKRGKPDEIVTKLRQVEVLCGQGIPRVDAIRQVQTTEQTFCRWRKQYGGMGTDQLKELKRFQKENDRLRRTVWTSQALCDLPNIVRKLLVLLNVQLRSPFFFAFRPLGAGEFCFEFNKQTEGA